MTSKRLRLTECVVQPHDRPTCVWLAVWGRIDIHYFNKKRDRIGYKKTRGKSYISANSGHNDSLTLIIYSPPVLAAYPPAVLQ